MEKSTEPTLPKILISYEEFQRLKHIEEKYIQLQTSQRGAGITGKLILTEKI